MWIIHAVISLTCAQLYHDIGFFGVDKNRFKYEYSKWFNAPIPVKHSIKYQPI